MTTYAGQLVVIPNEFPMEAERFIVRDDEIAFDFRYREEYGADEEEHLDAIAKRQPEGFYKRDGTGQGDEQTIYIIRAEILDTGYCDVEGFWLNVEGSWQFSGKLAPIHPTVGSAVNLRGGS